jgi:hypothetical protein
VWPGEEIPRKNEHGFKKRKDVKAASLKDFPGTGGRLSFSFESAARSVDAGIYYGAIHWSFVVDSGKSTARPTASRPVFRRPSEKRSTSSTSSTRTRRDEGRDS